jgi:NTP pyrophosphatase (non-canonical NTP hydrolase)
MAGSKRVSDLNSPLDQIWIDEEIRNSPNILAVIAQQCSNDSHAWFPDNADDLVFQVLALAGEVGELANEVKKWARGSVSEEQMKERARDEATDVLIYLMCIFAELDIDPLEAYRAKRRVNELRFGPAAGRSRPGLRNEVGPENGDGG